MWWLESHQRKVEVNQQQVYFLKRTFCFIFCFFFFFCTKLSACHLHLCVKLILFECLSFTRLLLRDTREQNKHYPRYLCVMRLLKKIRLTSNSTRPSDIWNFWNQPCSRVSAFYLRIVIIYSFIGNTLIHNKHLFSLQIISVHSKLYFQQRTSHACCKHLIFGEKLFRSLTDFLWVLFQKPDSSSRRMNSGPLDRSLCRRVLQTKCARPLGDPPRPSFAAEEHTLACSSKTIVCRENEIHAYTKTFSEPPWIRPLPFNN